MVRVHAELAMVRVRARWPNKLVSLSSSKDRDKSTSSYSRMVFDLIRKGKNRVSPRQENNLK